MPTTNRRRNFRRRRRPMNRRRGRYPRIVPYSKTKATVTTNLTRAPTWVELKRSFQATTTHVLGTEDPVIIGQALQRIIFPRIAIGGDQHDRIGNHIKLKRLVIRLMVTNKMGESNFLRVALLRENFRGSISALDDPSQIEIMTEPLLVDGSGASVSISAAANDPFSMIFPWDPKIIRVVWDKRYNIAGTATSRSVLVVTKSFVLERHHYYKTATSVSDTSPRYFLLVYMADRTSTVTPDADQMKLQLYTELYFSDN